MQVKRLHGAAQVQVASDAVAAIGQGEDVAFLVGGVKFVFNFADDLLQHILHRDQSGDVAKLIDDDGQVVVVAAKFAQQIVQALGFRDEVHRAQQGAQLQGGRALQLEQVFGHEHANDVFACAFVHRKA